MELDYSCLNEKPNQEVMTFLETASIRKITISQQSKTCEIFLACETLPDDAMYLQCLQFFKHNMAKASKVRLIVQPKVSMGIDVFLIFNTADDQTFCDNVTNGHTRIK